MSGVLRIVLTWILAAALPLQGVAAASMTLCGTPGAGAAAHHQVDDRSGEPATTMHAMPGHDVVQDHAEHGHDGRHSQSAEKCSVCAACCASLAIAVADFALPPVALSESFASPFGAGVSPFVTEGLERPPRTSSFA